MLSDVEQGNNLMLMTLIPVATLVSTNRREIRKARQIFFFRLGSALNRKRSEIGKGTGRANLNQNLQKFQVLTVM